MTAAQGNNQPQLSANTKCAVCGGLLSLSAAARLGLPPDVRYTADGTPVYGHHQCFAGEDTRFKALGIPQRFQDFRLTTSPVAKTQPELIKMLTAPPLPDWDSEKDQIQAEDIWQTWLNASFFLWGPYGVGKTGLAVGYAYQQLHHGVNDNGQKPRVLFRTTPQILAELRNSYSKTYDGMSEAEIIKRYSQADVLIMDDLGAEHIRTGNEEWTADRLYQIIGYRHAEELPTLFTSNLDIAQTGKRIGERITWRIVEMCGPQHICKVTGPNLRDVKSVPSP